MAPHESTSRRRFLGALAVAAAGAGCNRTAVAANPSPGEGKPQISCQQVPWLLYARREAEPFDLETAVAGAAAAGLDAFEPIAASPDQTNRVASLLKKHGLAMRSLYVEGVLHDEPAADSVVQKVLAIAEAARPFGTKIILVRPLPIPNGREEPKTDDQLRLQARQLDRLGAMLVKREMTLAWPNHDIELRHSAREFHHMLAGTDPDHVGLCLDAHWAYRGTGNSRVALFDLVTLYARRVVELHLRQSQGGTFTEEFSDGDIDYRRLNNILMAAGAKPHLVLDQAPEADTPKTMSAVDAHRRGRTYAQSVFAS